MEKKSNKGLIVLVVILAILLVGSIGYICYDKFVLDKDVNQVLSKTKNDLKVSNEEKDKAVKSYKDAVSKVKKLEDNSNSSVDEKNYIISRIHSSDNINIYAICNKGIFYAYKGKMYFGSSTGDNFYDILYNDKPNKSDKSSGYTVINLGLKEDSVKKIFVTNNSFTRDSQQSIYLIMSDGSVRYYSTIDIAHNDYKTILKKYQVSDLDVVGCGKSGELGCLSLKYELTLMDGSKKVVVE